MREERRRGGEVRERSRERNRGKEREGGERRVEMSSNTLYLSLHFIIPIQSLSGEALVSTSLSCPPSAPPSAQGSGGKGCVVDRLEGGDGGVTGGLR